MRRILLLAHMYLLDTRWITCEGLVFSKPIMQYRQNVHILSDMKSINILRNIIIFYAD